MIIRKQQLVTIPGQATKPAVDWTLSYLLWATAPLIIAYVTFWLGFFLYMLLDFPSKTLVVISIYGTVASIVMFVLFFVGIFAYGLWDKVTNFK